MRILVAILGFLATASLLVAICSLAFLINYQGNIYYGTGETAVRLFFNAGLAFVVFSFLSIFSYVWKAQQ